MNPGSPDVIVVGSGIFGSWITLAIRRAGHAVTMLERCSPGHANSSSGGESRIIRMAYGGDELYTTMSAVSLALWKQFLQSENKEDIFRQAGVLWLAHRANPTLNPTQAALTKAGVTHELLSTEDLFRRYPQIHPEPETLAIFEPESGALLAERAVEAVHEAAAREGAVSKQDTVLAPVGKRRLESIITKHGDRLTAGTFVFACGAWLPKLFPALLEGIIQPTRQELFFFRPPDHNFWPEHLPIWIDETDPRLAYGFPDLNGEGVKTAFHRLGPSFDPDEGNRQIGSTEIEEALGYLRKRFPALAGAELKSCRVCRYENTSSGDFLIDRHPEFENVWIVGGGSGHGFKHGPAIAEYLLRVAFQNGDPEERFLLRSKAKEIDRKVI